MKTTRQQILDHLEARRVSTSVEISQVLRMTPANARHHLNILLDEGVIETAGQAPVRGRGRPSLLYRLTQPTRQHSLDRLASALLEEISSNQPAGEREEYLRRIANRLLAGSSSSDQGRANRAERRITQALYETVQRLNEMHYTAHWEAHVQAPRLILGHCPFAAIIQDHPELCQMDTHLLEGLVGAPVRLTSRLVADERGQRQCVFVLDTKNK